VADTSPSGAGSGRGAHAPLPPLIHGRARLLILCALMNHPRGLSFTELRDEVGLTDGTLSVHLGKLEAGELVEIRKEFADRKPRTHVRMTRGGRARFGDYVEQLRALVPGLAPPES